MEKIPANVTLLNIQWYESVQNTDKDNIPLPSSFNRWCFKGVNWPTAVGLGLM
jgi:hypothetical protein